MFQISFHVLLFCFIKTGGCENTWFIPVCVRPDSAFFLTFRNFPEVILHFFFICAQAKYSIEFSVGTPEFLVRFLL